MAQYVTVAGTHLAIPSSSRADLAYTYTNDLGTSVPGSGITYTVPGEFIEVPINIFGKLATDGSTGNRTFLVKYLDENGAVSAQVFATTGQGASTTLSYGASTGTPVAYFIGGLGGVLPLPTAVLSAGFQVEITADNLAAGDTLVDVSLTTLRILTGPGLAPPATVVATPVLA